MRYIKFKTQAEAQLVCDRVFISANSDNKFAQGTTAYAIPENVEYFTVPVLDGFDSYFTQAELNGIEQFKEEKQGRLVVDDLLQLFKDNLTVNDTATILNYLLSVVVICLAGNLRAAKVIANNLATTAVYTAARKTWLVNRIQTEIDKL